MKAKRCRLELNNSGAWKILGRFDAADDDQTSLVLGDGRPDPVHEAVRSMGTER